MSAMRYTEEHEWVRLDAGQHEVVVGITPFAQEALGELVYVELPEEGTELAAGDEAGTLESVKAASEIYAPVSGTVTAVNKRLIDDPKLVNASPESEGWLFRMRMLDGESLDSLLDEASYLKLTGQ